MNSVLEFLSFDDPNFRVVSLGIVFLSMSAAIVGSFAFLRKRSLVGDAIAHAVLPGIAVAFILTHSKNPLILLTGALICGWIAMYCIEQINTKSKLSADTSIALVLSVFFGAGIFLLTYIQHANIPNQSGLDEFLFGKAASMTRQDLQVYCTVAIVLIIVIISLYKELMLLSFNPDFAQTSGLPVRFLKFTLNSVTVLAIAIGIQSVGVVLMAALLITPAAAARAWSDKLSVMIALAAFTGAASGLVGSYISYSAPAMSTGPWIVMSLSFFAMLSLFFAPKRGMLSRIRQKRANKHKIVNENLLKTFYKIGENKRNFQTTLSNAELLQMRNFTPNEFKKGIGRLKKKNLILADSNLHKLSLQGLEEAKRVVRLHRLWEMYLSQRMRLKADHIHASAESIEHIITPEIEEQLLEELNYPELDPHSSPIPYNK